MSATHDYGYRIDGPCNGERRVTRAAAAAAFAAYCRCDAQLNLTHEAYLSAFQFDDVFDKYMGQTWSTSGYDGSCWSPWLWFDIDRANDLDQARIDTATLVNALTDRYTCSDDSLLIFFSGSKGFHVGLPLSLANAAPSIDFNRVVRRFAEDAATRAGIRIDTAIYDKVRAFRAPNTRHAKTGLYKRRIELKDLIHGTATSIHALAKTADEFVVPAAPGTNAVAMTDWTEAMSQASTQTKALLARRQVGNGARQLNRQTLDFIRNGAEPGERHYRLYSAAANLAEFECPSVLAHALLEEPALDCGLTQTDVRQTIENGLNTRKGVL